MSEFKHSTDDITTDAVPNPRTTENKEQPESDNSINNNSAENIPKNEKQFRESSSYTYSTKRKTQKKFSPPSAVGTIINISKSSDIHVGNQIVYNFNGNGKKENKKTEVPKTPAIVSLMEKENPVTKEDLWFAATHIDSEWKDVARDLGIGDGQISQFIADNQIYGTKEVIYQILLDWYQNDPTKATVGKLCTILWNNNQKEVVMRWSQEKQ